MRIFVRGHCLFQDANNFTRVNLEDNCELRGADNVQEQISVYIFAKTRGYFILLSFKYFATRMKKSLRTAYGMHRGKFSLEDSLVRLNEQKRISLIL